MKPFSESIEKARNTQRYLKLAQKTAAKADAQLGGRLAEIEGLLETLTLSKAKAARLAGCDYTTLYRHEKQGKLKSLLITDVLDWIDEYKPGRKQANS